MLNTHLNIEFFGSDPDTEATTKAPTTFSMDCSEPNDIIKAKKALIDQAKSKCERLSSQNRYNIDYKQIREELFKLYEDIYNSCDDDEKENILNEIKKNINDTQLINNKKKEEIKKIKTVIANQDDNINEIEKEIQEHKNYDAVKQQRIIGSENLRRKSFIEYYVFIVLIIVFVLVQIILLLF